MFGSLGVEVLSRTGFSAGEVGGFDGVRNVYDTTSGSYSKASVVLDFELGQGFWDAHKFV